MSADDDLEIHEEHEGEHGEPWLVSYADMMTLLFGFFVLMYFFASQDQPDAWEKVRKGLSQSFGGEYVDRFQKVDDEIKDLFKGNSETLKSIVIEPSPNGVRIMFQSAILFDLGKAALRPEVVGIVNSIIQLIKERGSDLDVIIEGHTDNLPITNQRFPSNWELSAVRASTIVRLFEDAGFQRSRLQAVGFADTAPLFPNVDENNQSIPENQAKNRRVVIRVNRHLNNKAKKKSKPKSSKTEK